MIRTFTGLLIIAVLTLDGGACLSAQELSFSGYNCSVKYAYELSKDSLATSKLAPSYKLATFHVERKTGKMSGSHGVSSQGWIGRNEVLDLGSPQQSYKAIYISPPFVHLKTLLIQEYTDGPAKSFIYTDDTTVLTGNCTHVR